MNRKAVLRFDERPDFETQHRQIRRLIRRLDGFLGQTANNKELELLLESLVIVTRIHFTTEEHYMRSRGFPGHDAHKKEHAELLQELVDFQSAFRDNRQPVSQDILIYLRRWFGHHIKTTDRLYDEYVASELLPVTVEGKRVRTGRSPVSRPARRI